MNLVTHAPDIDHDAKRRSLKNLTLKNGYHADISIQKHMNSQADSGTITEVNPYKTKAPSNYSGFDQYVDILSAVGAT